MRTKKNSLNHENPDHAENHEKNFENPKSQPDPNQQDVPIKNLSLVISPLSKGKLDVPSSLVSPVHGESSTRVSSKESNSPKILDAENPDVPLKPSPNMAFPPKPDPPICSHELMEARPKSLIPCVETQSLQPQLQDPKAQSSKSQISKSLNPGSRANSKTPRTPKSEPRTKLDLPSMPQTDNPTPLLFSNSSRSPSDPNPSSLVSYGSMLGEVSGPKKMRWKRRAREAHLAISMEIEEASGPKRSGDELDYPLSMKKTKVANCNSDSGCKVALPTAMKIISWNVQGVGNRWTFRAVREVILTHKPQLLFLSETRTAQAESLRLKLKFDCCFSVERCGLGGGLALMWNKDLQVLVRSFNNFHIDSIIKDGSSPGWRFTGFYGDPVTSERENSWLLVGRLARNSDLPWLVGGDFNAILSAYEKEGGSNKTVKEIMRFQEALNMCSLCDLGWNGNIFTWCNRRFKKGLIKERLDRYVASYDWSIRFPGSKVTNIDAIGSDHVPIMLEVFGLENQYGKFRKKWGYRFRFEEMWAEYEECEQVVKSCWDGSGDLVEKSENCKQKLGAWSKRKFKGRFTILKNLKKEISKLKSLPPSSENAEKILKAEKEADNFLKEEVVYWSQRAKAVWLEKGDRNTKFFHARASARRKNNTISGLEDHDGVWHTEDVMVEN